MYVGTSTVHLQKLSSSFIESILEKTRSHGKTALRLYSYFFILAYKKTRGLIDECVQCRSPPHVLLYFGSRVVVCRRVPCALCHVP